jgi:hypothetical protein
MVRKGPLTWVGVAGFEPAASSSRTKRAVRQSRCLMTLLHVRAIETAHDQRAWQRLTAAGCG